jgi:flagellum-specific peptidoglycan hydrolase FlgJ
MDKVQSFLNEIKDGCLALWSNFSVLPSAAASQAALESGWGTSELATKYNNLFGIKGEYNGQSAQIPTT